MPRKHKIRIGTKRPIIDVGIPGSGPRRVIQGGDVWIGSNDPVIDVVGQIIGKPDCTPPRPRYQVDERHGRTSVPRYVGDEPLTQTIPLKLEASGATVEPMIRALESLAKRVPATGEPPVVQIMGPALRHQGFKWRVTAIEENKDRAKYAPAGDPQTLYVADVTLTQHVTDQLLAFAGRRARGIGLTDVVQRGEDSFYDVAKRLYRDRGKAKAIASANRLPVSKKLKPGQIIRLP